MTLNELNELGGRAFREYMSGMMNLPMGEDLHQRAFAAALETVRPLIAAKERADIVASLRERARWHATEGDDEWARDVLDAAADEIEKGEVPK